MITPFAGQTDNAKRSVCRHLPILLLLAAVSLALNPGFAAEGQKGRTPGNKGLAVKDFKLVNQEKVFMAQSIRNMRAIRMALTLANHQNGQFPARLQDAEIANPELLLSVTDLVAKNPALPLGFGSWPLDRQWQWAYDNCSFEYLPGQKEANPANILLYEKPKPHKKELPVYFMDGQARLATPEQLTKLLEKQNAAGKLEDADRKPLAAEPPSIK